MSTTDLVTQTKAALLERVLDRAGWRLLNVEIDLSSETARVEVRKGDLHVTFDARNGRATLTREIVTLCRVDQLVGSGRWRPERLHTRFIGRQSYEGVRSGLRAMSNYLADNAKVPTLRADVRDAMRLLMD